MRRVLRYLILLALVIAAFTLVRGWLRAPTIPAGSYLLVDLGGPLVEAPPPNPLSRLLNPGQRSLIDVLSAIRKAGADARIKGLVLRITALATGWAKVQDVRDALLAFKQGGKPIVALLEQEARGANKEYYLATAADRIYVSPNTTAPLSGLAVQSLFLGGLWEKLDITVDVEKIGPYKTVGDFIAGKSMTPAHREMANSLLDSLNEQFVRGIAEGRGLEPAAVQSLIDRCPVTPADFETARLCNGTRYLQDLRSELGTETHLVEMKDYAAVTPRSLGLGVGPRVAIVYAVGPIVSGDGGRSAAGNVVGAQTLVDALEQAADDASIKAIVLRIDSPGGSALASDLIWRATRAAGARKPLIASMSDVAGSGGYYIAAGATRIVAQPASLTGSIGVVYARPYVKGLLTRLGIHAETLTRGRYAAFDDITTPLTDQDRQRLAAEVKHIYDEFVQRVSAGRHLTPDRVDEIGRGRVWTGAQAKTLGLVDELGGFRVAVQAAKQAAGIAPDQEVELAFYPKPEGLLARISDMLDTYAARTNPVPPMLAEVVQALGVPHEDGAILAAVPERLEIR